MEIAYERTIDDLIEFNLHYMENSAVQRKARNSLNRSLITLASIFIILAIIWIFHYKDTVGAIFLVVGLFIIYLLWYNSNSQYKRRRLIEHLKEQNGETPNASLCMRTITIEADGYYEKSDFWESKIFWRSIREIVQTEKYLYLFETKGTAYIVPKRAFPDEDSFNIFVNTARDFHDWALNAKQKE